MVNKNLNDFEIIVRKAYHFNQSNGNELYVQHPFEQRDIHESLPCNVKNLFDNGHYPQATFEAFKYLDKVVQKISKSKQTGSNLMFEVFKPETPIIKLNSNKTESETDEQKGYQFLMAGSMLAIRNPRGHEVIVNESPDQCLDHLSLVSLLLRKIEQAGFPVNINPKSNK